MPWTHLETEPVRDALRRVHENVVVQGSVDEDMVASAFSVAARQSTDAAALYFRGGLGWILINSIVEHYQAEKIREPLDSEGEERRYCDVAERIDGLLADPSLPHFIVREYGIDPADLAQPVNLCFFRAGTTSIILLTQSASNQRIVVKALKYAFLDNPKIAEATETYGQRMEAVQHRRAPTPLGTRGKSFILMELIEGLTLREYVEDVAAQLSGTAKERTVRMVAERVIEEVSITLAEYAKKKVWHHDLSPDNLILKGTRRHADHLDGQDIDEVWVLDWGYNYLLSERVGSTAAVSLIQQYVDPELVEGHRVQALADLYSLGAILLELLAGRRISMAEQEHARTVAWETATPLAELIDIVMDRDPWMRTPWAPRGESGAAVYPGFIECLKLKFRMLDRIEEKSSAWELAEACAQLATGFAPSLVVGAFKRLQQVRDLGEKSRKLREYEDLRWQAIWMVVAQVVSTVTGGIVLWWFLRGDASVSAFVVCYSFNVVAANYYLNIYAHVSSWRLGKLGRVTAASMRFNTLCFAPPILLATVLDNSWWPYCSALGVAFVGINNFLTYLLAKRARIDASSDSTAGFLGYYQDWWWLMLVYAAVLVTFGVLLDRGTLTDEIAYALLSLAMNIKMIFVNVNTKAPIVRAGLNRLYSIIRRELEAAGRRSGAPSSALAPAMAIALEADSIE